MRMLLFAASALTLLTAAQAPITAAPVAAAERAFAKDGAAMGVGPSFIKWSTDDAVVTIDATRTQLNRDLLPYRLALRRSVRPVIMLSTAVYPAYSSKAAAWSTAIGTTLLRGTLGFKGVTITDSLTSAAAVRHAGEALLALRCARRGDDLLLLTGSEAASQQVYEALLTRARSGDITAANLQTSYDRIMKLKGRL